MNIPCICFAPERASLLLYEGVERCVSSQYSGPYAGDYAVLAAAEALLDQCEDEKNASQVDNCSVSATTGTWVDTLSGKVSCGGAVGKDASKVCPGGQVQLRYAANNNTNQRDVLVKAEAWFTAGTTLNVSDGSALRSSDVLQFTLPAASSTLRSDAFKLPTNAKSGDTFHVFVRAVPYDAVTGDRLWESEWLPGRLRWIRRVAGESGWQAASGRVACG